jgi:hypothetical protein
MPRTRARSSRRTASSALRPLRRQSGVVFPGRTADSGEGRGASRRLCPVAPTNAVPCTRNTTVVAEVLIVRTRALGEFRSDSIVERLPPTPVAPGDFVFLRGLADPLAT